MIIFPAIDIKEGKVVRLSQGKFHESTIYSSDPVLIARKWASSGAAWLHVIDLDGAEQGEIKNLAAIEKIVKSVKIPVQMGGGIRTHDDIARLFACGVARVILGTKAVENRESLKKLLEEWPEKIIVSLDCSRGIVTQKGWTAVSNLRGDAFAKELEQIGLKTLIYTDIARDGTLTGPNIKGIAEILKAVKIPVIASGGISQLDDIIALKELEPNGLNGIIIGKALYEGRFELTDAIKLCLPKG
ncbi:MAG TPA: 1-(5-phosphoribosyl)-5-[(5-phosphoribosylamino)methylideneamino]imidazole-4-carboxamide isomerase [Candidatus Omnitrophota bacterium]|nr:1-(5-phosphoribosyl)-5-[(5-phosphoribosylamino)methylideneamino]imidazole-4-carboxamide isomerase [Candidatus Omnitrophota bacterium]HPD85297.1 1-(5-phosphoribosyl)-5-[(5-phosphoribosylamino)methylideneamino]imidazole-4-carboxamide isomerase [Candidatus Omnitrophota bacterium]HRZ04202.1 1-(5-phosphoribosyl)-5-[(5-phosphoribosylamino)methylideneamino]imidazole-4-carboxamide isomerase [Candidatus Omnitrophota bacterium]